jgi:colicin import membrane protein
MRDAAGWKRCFQCFVEGPGWQGGIGRHSAMARRLKTYRTTLGFFDLAIAAPSMKAAAEAWGSNSNVFNKGFAKETHDPAIVAATMAQPGVVLRRPVGSNADFSEHAKLPKDLPIDEVSAH